MMLDPRAVGVVVIGRNEGDRLKRCLASLRLSLAPVVYVDSNSTDDSVEHAQSTGALVVTLDSASGFTAARARNLGWRRLLEAHPDLRYVQFIDGDCEVDKDWMAVAARYLTGHPTCAGVCGRRRERFPTASRYNGLCDMEWNTPIGPAQATGGDAMFNVKALQQVGGYRDTLIAGEEPEMCLRMRAAGWTLMRLDHEMTLHDAAMHRFAQWWKRSIRTGHAYAEGHFLHGGPPHHHYDREVRSLLTWAAIIPLFVVVSVCVLGPLIWITLVVFPLQVLRLWWRLKHDPRVPQELAWTQAALFVLGKFAELQGWAQFHAKRIFQRESVLIEYK